MSYGAEFWHGSSPPYTVSKKDKYFYKISSFLLTSAFFIIIWPIFCKKGTQIQIYITREPNELP